MRPFEFATAGRILFGKGRIGEIPALTAGWGDRALVVAGRDVSRADVVIDQLKKENIESVVVSIPGEPTVADVSEAAQQAREKKCSFVAGIGGGSPIDAAKAVAALITNPADPMEYLEVIGGGAPLKNDPVPCIAIPTTAGTGSEVTRNAVIKSPEHRVKVSMRHPKMLPDIALVDPELTFDLPPRLTASTGLDALTQVIEPFVSPKATPMTDGFCRTGIPAAAEALPRLLQDGSDREARESMALASLMGGLALANSGLGAVHGLAGPLGGMCEAPHGIVCGKLLPHVMRVNLEALRKRQPESPALLRFTEVARMITGRSDATAEEGIAKVEDICSLHPLPGLGEFGLKRKELSDVAAAAGKASSMKGNPLSLERGELVALLDAVL